MHSISVFLDSANFGVSRKKNADVSGTQKGIHILFGFIYSYIFFGLFGHVIHIIFGSTLDKVLLCQVALLHGLCDRF